MKKGKQKNWFSRILSLLFIIYVALFIAGKTGYYERTIRNKTHPDLHLPILLPLLKKHF